MNTSIKAKSSKRTPVNPRSNKASTLLELPVSIWMVFIVFFMPMMSLASITLKSTLLAIAVQDTVHEAARARAFATSSDEQASAKDLANTRFAEIMQAFPGLRASSTVDVDILITNVNSGATTRSEEQLTQAADSNLNVYQIEVSAQGIIDPLIQGNPDLFGVIPGFTAPAVISYSARQMFENPQGLNR